MSQQNKSIKDFFRPKPKSSTPKLPSTTPLPRPKLPVQECPHGNDEDLIVVARPGESNKRRKLSPSPAASLNSNSTSNKTKHLPTKDHQDVDFKAAIAASLNERPPTSNNMVPTRPSSSGLSDARLSFGSLPRSSQSGASKRVMEHGQEVVKGSDTETDDSDASLEDLSAVFSKKPAASSIPTASIRTSARNHASNSNKKSSHQTPKPPKKPYKFSLDALVAQTKKSSELQERAAVAAAKLQEYEDRKAALSSATVDKVTLTAIVEGGDVENEGNGRRVMEAMARADAFEIDEVWHFFEIEPISIPNHFPRLSTPPSRLTSMISDPRKRQQAFLNGYIPSVASLTPLPREVLVWMLNEVCTEKKENLTFAYMNTLEKSSSSIPSCLTPEQLQLMFKHLGVKPVAFTQQRPIQPTNKPPNSEPRPITSNLRHVADMLALLAPVLPENTRELAIDLLLRACFDDGIIANREITNAVESALSGLILASPEQTREAMLHRISTCLFNTISSPVLRHLLVTSVPCNEAVTHTFRRRLALAFSLNSPRWLSADLSNPALRNHVMITLTGSRYKINSKTDYVHLRANFNMLDIAIDSGFSDFSFVASRRLMNEPEHVGKISQEEKDFNAGIDAITKEMRELMARIVDSGASHMRRTEAKSTAERVAQRVEYGVRTRARRVGAMFEETEAEGGAEFRPIQPTVKHFFKHMQKNPNGEGDTVTTE